MTRSKRFLQGAAATYSYQAVVILTGFWLTPFYLGRIGQSDYGLWLVGTQLLMYLSITDFGIVALLPQETAYATGRAGGVEQAHDLAEIVGRAIRVVLYQVPLVAIVAGVLWLALPSAWGTLRGPLAIILVGYVAVFPLRILTAVLQGLQDLSFAAMVQALNWAFSTGATVIMVSLGWNLYALAIGWVLSQLVFAPVLLYRLRTRYPSVLPNRLPPLTWTAVKVQFAKGGWVTVAQIAQLLLSNTDLLIIGKLLGPAAVVPYACTGKLASILANQAQILMQTATPGLCELKASEQPKRLFQALVGLSQILLTFSGLVFCLVLVVNQWFVGWWVNAAQYGGSALTVAILINIVFVHWNTVAAYGVFCLGHQKRIALTNLGNGIATAGGCLVFAHFWGPVGAPLGSLVGTCLVGLPFNLRRIARDTGVSVFGLVGETLGSWFVRFAPLAALCTIVAQQWSPKNLFEAAGVSFAIAGLYLAVMIPFLLRSSVGSHIRVLWSSLLHRFAFTGAAL